jgi:hypothetical protein
MNKEEILKEVALYSRTAEPRQENDIDASEVAKTRGIWHASAVRWIQRYAAKHDDFISVLVWDETKKKTVRILRRVI